MPAAFHQHFGGACHGGSGVGHGLCPGQAAGHCAVCQRLQKDIHIGRAAAGQGTGGIDKGFLQRIQQAAAGHISQPVLQNIFLHQRIAAVGNQTLPHGNRGVGHDADNGDFTPGKLLNLCHGQPRRHGNEQRLSTSQNLLQGGEAPLHHVGLHPQKDSITGLGNDFIGGIGDFQLLCQSLSLAGAVGKGDVLCCPAQGCGDGTAHVSAADKSVFHKFPS